ncbi:MAG: hypothetical protein UT42_C0002G0002 [Candidatus Falkowbacteria bacterium GW2011_GWA2_39_24]|uniref:DUF6922 domain-containing protein n=1 Tax=Candidatus Falkowbacteria bacterium GW2011_GWA2_39_24 TaxID=1618634 RepID=A0A0G0NRK3_9BACT|nr:MAG: hypothetical protein UT42_C0002G0002 [Candidatus Falkowbacteria bacterium GW2011_GWA2_39_24]
MLAKALQPFFWYTNNKKIDQARDKKRIILQTLNYGDSRAVTWLLKNYSRSVIKKAIINYGGSGELDKKSLNYWCLRFNIKPKQLKKTRI